MRHVAKLVLGLGLVSLAGAVVVEAFHRRPAPAPATLSLAPPAMRIPLIGDDGKATTLAERRGAWMVLLFGYMACPDACPTGLAYMHEELAQRYGRGETIQGLFVSLDPQHDKPEALGAFARRFDPHFRAYTGTEPNLQALARELGAFGELKADPKAPGGQALLHSPQLFILDPAGRLIKTISPPFAPGELAKELGRQLAASTH